MIRIDAHAQGCLDRYLEQVRTHLQGCQSVDPTEVERDVREHIERELEEVPEPVCFNDLDAVLNRLGSPAQWVPAEEVPWWRKVLMRLRHGPEDWRLAYLSFGGFVAAFVFGGPLSPVLIVASFCLARATLASTPNPNELRGQKWLVYPSLIIVYLFVCFWVILGPSVGLVAMADTCENSSNIELFPWTAHDDLAYWPIASMFIAAGSGLWWIVLGYTYKTRARWFHAVFRPFAQVLGSRSANWLMGVGVLLLLIGSVAGGLMVTHSGWYWLLKQWNM